VVQKLDEHPQCSAVLGREKKDEQVEGPRAEMIGEFVGAVEEGHELGGDEGLGQVPKPLLEEGCQLVGRGAVQHPVGFVRSAVERLLQLMGQSVHLNVVSSHAQNTFLSQRSPLQVTHQLKNTNSITNYFPGSPKKTGMDQIYKTNVLT